MKLKEAQLLGILAILAGGIIILSMWGSKPSSEEPRSEQGESVRIPGQEEAEPPSGVSEEGAVKEWEWLTETEQEKPESQKSRKEPGSANLNLEGEAESIGSEDFGMGDGFQVGRQLEEELETELAESDPERIGLRQTGEIEAGRAPENSFSGQKPEIYEVKKHDTLSAISRKFYGTDSKWKKILEANHAVVERPEDLRPQMKLVIPSPSTNISSAEGSSDSDSEKPLLVGEEGEETRGRRYHKVKKQETLWMLAEKFYGSGKEYKKILKANKDLISTPGELQEGMRLVIPR